MAGAVLTAADTNELKTVDIDEELCRPPIVPTEPYSVVAVARAVYVMLVVTST